MPDQMQALVDSKPSQIKIRLPSSMKRDIEDLVDYVQTGEEIGQMKHITASDVQRLALSLGLDVLKTRRQLAGMRRPNF